MLLRLGGLCTGRTRELNAASHPRDQQECKQCMPRLQALPCCLKFHYKIQFVTMMAVKLYLISYKLWPRLEARASATRILNMSY